MDPLENPGDPARAENLTRVVNRAIEAGPHASEELFTVIYNELRQMAAAKMVRERPQTLQATALVHEAWMRLGNQKFENRAHFFGAAAEAMRRILVERARRRARQKRGGDLERCELDEAALLAPVSDEQLLEVNGVLDELARTEPVKAQIVKLRFFVGLENQEIASLLDVNEKTIRRHWQVAKILLFQMIKRR